MRNLCLIICLLFATVTQAITLKANCPKQYIVQPGDTLWTIACRFLEHPWEWKQLWYSNPKIKNPNRIFPGAVLELRYYQSMPYIKVLSNGTIKLSPNIRPFVVDDAIPPIPLGEIKPFLNESLVLDRDVLSRAPYIVAYMGERMLGGQGDEVYVKGLHPSTEMPQGSTIAYSVFRAGLNYVDPNTKEFLGYKAKLVGYGELEAGGEPATLLLTSIIEGVRITDKVLINNHPEFELFFEPETPSTKVNGLIIDMPAGNVQEAMGGVVVISLGQRNGLKPGDVLGIYGKQRIVKDPKNLLVPIKLPRERVGEAMVFRTFSKTSFALIVRSVRAIYRFDCVTNP